MASNNFVLKLEKENQRSFTDAAVILFAIIATLGVVLRFRNLTASYVWLDEMFSLEVARLGWGSLLSFVLEDVVHPPLFYMLLKLWVGVGGESLLWIRLFPFLIAVAALVPFVLLCRELKLGMEETNVALMLISVNGFLIYYAQEVRMYSPLFFLTVCSLWLFARYVNAIDKQRRALLILAAVNLALVYTHYYGWLVVGTEFIFLLLWERTRLKSFFWAVSAIALLFSPWAYAVGKVLAGTEAGLGQNLAWLSQPSLYRVLTLYSTFTGSFEFPHRVIVGTLLFGFPILFWGWRRLTGSAGDPSEDTRFKLLLSFAFLPTAMLFVASRVLSNPVWLPRGLIIVAPAFLMLVAVAVVRLRNEWLKNATLLIVLGWATLAGVNEINKPDYRKVAWNGLGQHIAQAEAHDASGIKVYALDKMPAYSLRFYFDHAKENRFEVVAAQGEGISIPGIDPYFLKHFPTIPVDDLRQLKEDHFWIVFIEAEWPQAESPQQLLASGGFKVGESVRDPTSQICLFPVWRHTEVTGGGNQDESLN